MEHEPARRTSLIRLAIVVEGRTEEEFVKQVLYGHLINHGVSTAPIVIGPPGHRGGRVTVNRIATHVQWLVQNFDAITTLVDFYGFQDRPTDDVDELQSHIDAACQPVASRPLRPDRVFAYVQRHEFEALLFSDVSAFRAAPVTSEEAISRLESVRQAYPSPEDIDDGRDTAPSKRIEVALPGYRKPTHGIAVAADVGIDAMKRECPRFAAWLTRLESLGSGADAI